MEESFECFDKDREEKMVTLEDCKACKYVMCTCCGGCMLESHTKEEIEGEFLEDNYERAHTPVEIGRALNMHVLDTRKPLMALIKKRLVTRNGKYYRWIGYSTRR